MRTDAASVQSILRQGILRQARTGLRGLPLACGLALALACAAPAWAQDQSSAQNPKAEATGWYQLEAILFLRRDAASYQTYHKVSADADGETAVGLQGIAAPVSYWQLNSDDRFLEHYLPALPLSRLQDALQRLQSRGFEILWAASWKQPLQAAYPNLPLYIQAYEQAPGLPRLTGTLTLSVDKFIDAKIDLDYTEYVGTSLSLPEASVQAQFQEAADAGGIEAGTTAGDSHSAHPTGRDALGTVSHGTVLHDTSGTVQAIAYDLRPELETAPLQWQALGSHRLRDQRRLREGELHYLDHAALGLLLIANQASEVPVLTTPTLAEPMVSPPEAATAAEPYIR